MATLKQIQFKRSKTAGARPAASVLAEGELAINLKDRVLFTKDDQGNIIDLGFAKGGSIDGNVIHKGNYNQTGDYTLNGTFTQTGNFNLTGIARVTRDIIAAGQIMTEGGELITKSSGTSHVRFHDSADRERGIIFSPANDGLTTQVINIRVQDYKEGTENTFAFNGNGLFSSPEVFGWKSVSTPVIYTNKVITNKKVKDDYDIYSMADNVPLSESTTAINHLRVMRNAVGAGVFHEVKDNDGITWYTGDGLDTYLWSFTWSGGLKAGHSISVGTPGGNKGYSELGTASIALGDNDTGLVHGGDGRINMVANGMHIASWSSAYHLHEGLWDTTGALWTEQGRAIISFGHLIQQSDSYSTYVRDVYVRSDIRVKKDLVKFENASEKLSKINGYTYMQKRGLDEEGNQKWEPNAGLIAQEVQAILPELVEGDPDGEALLRLNYNGVIGLNTAAINEHTAEIAELKSEIEELKALVKSLLK